MAIEQQTTPIYILSGFLGSGKTTLLKLLLNHWKSKGLRPAVIMNELGEVNLDGLLLQQEVPMAEMLGGCICCTIRGDLSLELSELIQKEQPDVVVIEATGAANPLEILDAVTEAALFMKLEIKPVVTVVDSPYLLELLRSQQGKTYRLMQEQIRCASVLIMNKTDLLKEGDLVELERLLQQSNPFALKIPAVKCSVDLSVLLGAQVADNQSSHRLHREEGQQDHAHYVHDGEGQDGHDGEDHEDHEGHAYQGQAHHHDHHHDHHDHDHAHHNHEDGEHHDHTHHTHEHVMVYTHYFNHAVDSVRFEQLIANLPRDVYRAKGVLTFSDTRSRYLFQYAYREPDFMKITPQGEVPDVVVFIGEHFDKLSLQNMLAGLEAESAPQP